MFIFGIYRVLSLLYTKLLTYCLAPNPVNMKKCPIHLGSLMHLSIRTPQITNVHEANTMTARLHKSLLLGNQHIHLWHGCCTLTGGRIKPMNSKTYALSDHLLLKHFHANQKKLQHLQTRVLRSLKGPQTLQTPRRSYGNPSYYTYQSC